VDRNGHARTEQVHRFGGTVLGFSGDAFTCWLDGDEGMRSVACAQSLQRWMADQAGEVMRASSAGAAQLDPVALRDHAVLELLYATGVRVAELCGLGLGDVDFAMRVVRVLGKGDKERTVPFGLICFSVVTVWYALHGHAPDEVTGHRARARWYTTKTEPSYDDMAVKLRRVIIAARFRGPCPEQATPQETRAVLAAWAAAGT